MTPDAALLLSLFAPLVGAIFCLWPRGRRFWAVAGIAAGLIGSSSLLFFTADGSVHALASGSWRAPFGIVLVADALAAFLLVVCQLVVLAGILLLSHPRYAGLRRRQALPLLLTLSLGASGAFLTGDLFNLYVWFEVLLLSSFALMSLVRGQGTGGEVWRYVIINLVSSLLFLAGAGLIYSKMGTLNFADLHLRLQESPQGFLVDSSAALLFGAFGIKAALLPLAFWLPHSYPLLPGPIGGIFAGILTKVGLYAFYRVFGFVFAEDGSFPWQPLLLVLAILTMLGGVLGAVAQGEMRRILTFHIISQVGYMALALALFTPLALAAGIYYLAHHIIVKANLFFAAGLVETRTGSSQLDQVRGLAVSAPVLAWLFALPALSLAGLPPLSGFFAKFSLLRSALEAGEILSAVAIVLVGLLTLFSMLKIWLAVFWGDPDPEAPARSLGRLGPAASLGLGLVTVSVGLLAGPLFEIAQRAAYNLLEPTAYLEAVLGPLVP